MINKPPSLDMKNYLVARGFPSVIRPYNNINPPSPGEGISPVTNGQPHSIIYICSPPTGSGIFVQQVYLVFGIFFYFLALVKRSLTTALTWKQTILHYYFNFQCQTLVTWAFEGKTILKHELYDENVFFSQD